MVKKALDWLIQQETKYIRVSDEAVHWAISYLSDKVEEKIPRLNRDRQTRALMLTSGIAYSADFFLSGGTNQPVFMEAAKWAATFPPVMLDLYCQTDPITQAEGPSEVHSYNSIIGQVRPYAFVGSVGSIIGGTLTQNYEVALLGAESLPWVTSFYTRDTKSGQRLPMQQPPALAKTK